MSIKRLYSVRDSILGFYPPVVSDNDAAAMRDFSDACMRRDSSFSLHPDDYSLMFIGSFDTDTGELIPDFPKNICSALDFRKE